MKHPILHELDIQAPHTPSHKASLRHVLMHDADASQSTITRSRWRLIDFKGVMNMKKSILMGGGVTMIALVMGAVTLFSPLNPRVAAAQATSASIRVVSQLSSSELADLKAVLAADPQALLQEASSAKDLTKISRADFEKLVKKGLTMQYSDSVGNSSGKVEGKTGDVANSGTVEPNTVPTTPTDNTADTKTGGNSATGSVDITAIERRISTAEVFVTYTNNKGQTVVIAFDKNNSPVYTALL